MIENPTTQQQWDQHVKYNNSLQQVCAGDPQLVSPLLPQQNILVDISKGSQEPDPPDSCTHDTIPSSSAPERAVRSYAVLALVASEL